MCQPETACGGGAEVAVVAPLKKKKKRHRPVRVSDCSKPFEWHLHISFPSGVSQITRREERDIEREGEMAVKSCPAMAHCALLSSRSYRSVIQLGSR